MTKAGTGYQDEAAEFFRSIDLSAETEKRICGARGSHTIDVWVTGKLQSFEVKWIVECKDWKSSVSKEKVLALQAITQDVGADRAFLLSEAGFQAGAVRCAQYTNIELTSLRELRDRTREQLIQGMLWSLSFRVSHLIESLDKEPVRIMGVTPAGCLYNNSAITHQLDRMKQWEKALFDACRGRLPVRYGWDETHGLLTARTLDEVLTKAQEESGEAERLLAQLRGEFPDR